MVSIYESQRIDAPLDRVWNIISDVDRDPEYWRGLASIHNIRKEANLVEREVIVGFMGSKATQMIRLNPKESIELTLTGGPLSGSRTIRLANLGPESTKIEVSWNIEFERVPAFAQDFVRSRLEENTHQALEKIAKAIANSE